MENRFKESKVDMKTFHQTSNLISLPTHAKSFSKLYARNRNYSRIFYIGFIRLTLGYAILFYGEIELSRKW